MKSKIILIFLLLGLIPLFAAKQIIVEEAYIDSLLQQIDKADPVNNFHLYEQILQYKMQNGAEDYPLVGELMAQVVQKMPSKIQNNYLIDLSKIFRNHDKFVLAQQYLKQTLKGSKRKDDKLNMGRAYLNLGDLNRYQADFFPATENYLKALEIFEELKSYSNMIIIYSKISLAYKEMEDFESSMQNLQKAKELLQVHQDDEKLISILTQISNLYKRQRNLDLAEEYILRAYNLSQKIGFKRGILSSKGNLAILLLFNEKYEAAIEQFHELLDSDKSSIPINSLFEIKIYNLLCEAYLKTEQYALSEKYGKLAIKLSTDKGYQNSQKVAHQNISELYQATGDFQKALSHYQTSQEIDNKIAEQSILNATKELETKYQTVQKEKEILRLKEQERIRRLRFLMVIVALLLVVIILFFIFFLYRLKSRAHKELTVEIAERKRTEKLLEENSKLLHLIIDSIPVHLFLKNRQMKFQIVNQTMKDYYHLKDEDFIGHDLSELSAALPLYSDLFEKCDKMDKRTLELNSVQQLLSKSLHPQTQEEQWFYIKTIPIKIGDEQLLLGVAQDFTELKKAQHELEKINENLEYAVEKRTLELNNINKKLKAEIYERIKIAERLADSEKQYKTLLHNIPQKVFYKNSSLEYMLCNFSFAKEFNLPQADIIGKTDVDLLPQEAAELLQANDRKVFSNKHTMSFEETIFLNGSEHIYYSVKTPIYHKDDQVVGILGIFWDITEQRRAEKQLLYSERIAGIGELAGGVAHEIKNPLSNISSAIQLLEEDIEANAEIKSLINIIHDSVQDASSTIHKLIEFGSPRDFQMIKANIEPILENTCSLLRGKFTASNIRLKIIKDPEIPPTMLDEVHLKSAFMNIILNAIQAMTQGGELTIRIEAEEKKNIKVIFADTGCGIEKRHLQKIYDPFYTTKKEGSGLGMGLIHSVIKFHGGSINIESEIDLGTVITIILPIV
ncbi:MAG: PAS domain-containing protein [Candidatus Cloacimonadales bacterium]